MSAIPDHRRHSDTTYVELIGLLTDEVCDRDKRVEQLEGALLDSRLIGVATGIVMAIDDLSEEAAIDALVRCSHRIQCKIHTLAAHVIEARALPADQEDGFPC